MIFSSGGKMKIKKLMTQIVIRYPWLTIIFFLAVTSASAVLLPELKQDTNPFLLPPTHKSRVVWEKTMDAFTGLKGSTYILLEARETVFNRETLARIQGLTEVIKNLRLIEQKDKDQLKKLAGQMGGYVKSRVDALLSSGLSDDSWEELEAIQKIIKEQGQLTDDMRAIFNRVLTRLSPVVEVTSLSETSNILGVDGGLEINPIYEEVPDSAADMKRIRRQVEDNELFNGVLSIDNGKFTSIIIETTIEDDDAATKYLMYQKLLEILNKTVPGPEKHFIAGMPVFSATLSHTMETDTRRLFPIVFLLVIFCLWVSFRMFKGILVPLLVVVFSLVWTLSLKVLFDIPLNIISTALPVFILSIGVADGIHIFSDFRDHMLDGLNKIEAIKQTMRELTSPVVMTSLTTASAFFALAVTDIIQIRHFGIFVAVGTLIAMVFSLLFIPALLGILPQSAMKRTGKTGGLDRFVRVGLEKISQFAITKPRLVLLTAGIISVVALYGLTLVKVENNPIGYFKQDSELVRATNKIDDRASGSIVLNILVEAQDKEDEPLKNPENLKTIMDLSTFLDGQPHVGKVLGLPQLIRRINLVLHNNDLAFNRIPDKYEKIGTGSKEILTEGTAEPAQVSRIPGRQMISQYLLLYENSGGEVLTDVVDSNYRQTNLSVMIKTNSSTEIAGLTEKIKQYIMLNFPENLQVTYSGTAHLSTESTIEIVNGQITSFILSLALTFFLLILTFKSAKTGLFAIMPLLTTVLVNFGVMGFLGIHLNIGSAIISSIVIGVGVDYSIHYLSRFQENIKNRLSFRDAIMRTVRFSGKAILANAFTVSIGFIALLFSAVTPLITVGGMIILTMFVSSFCTIVLLPALLSVFQKSPVLQQSKNDTFIAQTKPETI